MVSVAGSGVAEMNTTPDAAMRAASGEKPRPSIKLLTWRSVVKGTRRGFADIELPIRLRIKDVPVHCSHGTFWVSLPAKPVLDGDGKQVEGGGKRQYAALLQWRSDELRSGFSANSAAAPRP